MTVQKTRVNLQMPIVQTLAKNIRCIKNQLKKKCNSLSSESLEKILQVIATMNVHADVDGLHSLVEMLRFSIFSDLKTQGIPRSKSLDSVRR